jgi:hypothetical protein
MTDGGDCQNGRIPCRGVTRQCSSFLTMAPPTLSSHHLRRQDLRSVNVSCSERRGNRQVSPPKALTAWRSPRRMVVFDPARIPSPRHRRGWGWIDSCQVGWLPAWKRDGDAGTLAGGPNAPSHSCPPSPHSAVEATRTSHPGRTSEASQYHDGVSRNTDINVTQTCAGYVASKAVMLL